LAFFFIIVNEIKFYFQAVTQQCFRNVSFVSSNTMLMRYKES